MPGKASVLYNKGTKIVDGAIGEGGGVYSRRSLGRSAILCSCTTPRSFLHLTQEEI